MKKRAVAAWLAAGSAVVLLGNAPAAHADRNFNPVGVKGDESLAEVREDVATIDNDWALAMEDDTPAVICGALRRGIGETRAVATYEEYGIPHVVAEAFVYSAEYHFCPDYY